MLINIMIFIEIQQLFINKNSIKSMEKLLIKIGDFQNAQIITSDVFAFSQIVYFILSDGKFPKNAKVPKRFYLSDN